MRQQRIHVLIVLGLLGPAGCDASLDQRLAIIHEPRVLAITTEPAEAKPGMPVTYRALVASPDGPSQTVPRWSYCTAPKPPTEDNAVSADCVAGDSLLDLGTALEVTATLPRDGCIRFGPDTPPGGFRPRDADATGGYYQPVRADVDGVLAFGLSRITCKLPTAPTDVARDYDLHYVANRNPTLDPFMIDAAPAHTDVTLTVSWPDAAAETFLYYDPASQQLAERREALRLSWFATGGALAVDASAVDDDDHRTSVATTWTTPDEDAWVWVVLRDSRGGLASQAVFVTVTR